MANRPLILLTNDDGIQSPGLHAVAEAVAELGDLLIMAPSNQQTGSGRSYAGDADDTIRTTSIPLGKNEHVAYTTAVSPAQATRLAIIELTKRPIDLCISGINFGENVGSGVTISGTVGAAIEAACSNIPALAVSLETAQAFHRQHSDEVDFSTAAYFAHLFAQKVLAEGLPEQVDILKIEVPASATPQTEWRMSRLSRQRYYQSVLKRDRLNGEASYQVKINLEGLEPDSDIYVFAVEKLVAVSPMTIDLTAPIALSKASEFYRS